MTEAVLGLDTSNYRTSAALVDLDGRILWNRRELLPVAPGERGLRQSDALYAHLKGLKPMLEEMRTQGEGGISLCAVCASTRPRARQDSYMPVFEAGETVGRAIAAAGNLPFYATDHQHGHIRAAAHGTELEGAESYLAFHLSGGTTDLLSIQGEQVIPLGSSLDLHAGQLVDRAGVAMGLSFPAGPEMEELARRGQSQARLGCAMAQGDLCCHFSGAEAQIQRWMTQGVLSREEIAREVYDLLARTAARMIQAGGKRTGQRRILICGGIASSPLFREMLRGRMEKQRERLHPVFGAPELSGDNAVGAALIGLDRFSGRQGLPERTE